MFKKFPSYFSIIAAIIFILSGLFIGLSPYTILVGAVIVIIAALIVASVIRIYLEMIFPEPEKPEPEEEAGYAESALEEEGIDYSNLRNKENPSDSFESESSDAIKDFAEFDNFPESEDEFLNEDNIDENEE